MVALKRRLSGRKQLVQVQVMSTWVIFKMPKTPVSVSATHRLRTKISTGVRPPLANLDETSSRMFTKMTNMLAQPNAITRLFVTVEETKGAMPAIEPSPEETFSATVVAVNENASVKSLMWVMVGRKSPTTSELFSMSCSFTWSNSDSETDTETNVDTVLLFWSTSRGYLLPSEGCGRLVDMVSNRT